VRFSGRLEDAAMTPFNMLRSNDLIWSYASVNLSEGQAAGAFDLVALKSDATTA